MEGILKISFLELDGNIFKGRVSLARGGAYREIIDQTTLI